MLKTKTGPTLLRENLGRKGVFITDLISLIVHSCNRIVNLLKRYINQGNALVVKLVDTKDLKSLPIRECRFESGRGHQKFNSTFS